MTTAPVKLPNKQCFILKLINFENYLRRYYTAIYKIIKIINLKNCLLFYVKYNRK